MSNTSRATPTTGLDQYKLLPVKSVLELLGVRPTKLASLIREQALQCVWQGNKRYIPRTSLIEYMNELAPSLRVAATDALREHDGKPPLRDASPDGGWEMCPVAACHRRFMCMYTPCRVVPRRKDYR
jgi:Helix-turn-helix domain